jgi:hypothetical protein
MCKLLCQVQPIESEIILVISMPTALMGVVLIMD